MKKNKVNKIILTIFIIIFAVAIICLIGMLLLQLNTEETPGFEEITYKEENSGIINNAIYIDDVPVIEVYSSSSKEARPLIIMQHGLGGDKTNLMELAQFYASNGFFVVCPDAYAHGDYFDVPEKSVIEIAIISSNNFHKIIDFYEDNSIVDNEKLGLIGFSMGGLASFYFSAESDIKPDVVCTISSTPKWGDLLTTGIAYNSFSNGMLKNITEQMNKDLINSLVQDNSPYEALLNYEDIDFFMINGAKDEIVLYYGPQDFNESFCGNSRFYLINNMAHEITDDLEEKLLEMYTYVFDKLF